MAASQLPPTARQRAGGPLRNPRADAGGPVRPERSIAGADITAEPFMGRTRAGFGSTLKPLVGGKKNGR
jgi:hypothetical protein